jgi:hypothetical protein
MALEPVKINLEVYFFPSEKKLDSPNVHLFTEEKRGLWVERLEDVRGKNVPVGICLEKMYPPENKRGIIVFDCRDVFVNDIERFTRQTSLWNERGYEVHVCCFVESGTETHAGLLAQFDDPCLQRVLKSLFVVFDREEKEAVIQLLLENNEKVPVIFADDETDNFPKVPVCFAKDDTNNANKVVLMYKSKGRIHTNYYTTFNKRSKDSTPDYAEKIDNFDTLVLSSEEFFRHYFFYRST